MPKMWNAHIPSSNQMIKTDLKLLFSFYESKTHSWIYFLPQSRNNSRSYKHEILRHANRESENWILTFNFPVNVTYFFITGISSLLTVFPRLSASKTPILAMFSESWISWIPVWINQYYKKFPEICRESKNF